MPSAATDADEDLRPVSWSDLVARLDAARDLRAELQRLERDSEASFDSGCARHIAAICDGKPGINLDDLVNGKGTGGNKRADHNRVTDDA